MLGTKSEKLLKGRETRLEDGIFIKKRKPDELKVEKKILYFFKDDRNFHVPKIIDNRTSEGEIATTYIPGMQATRFFHLLNIINNYAARKQLGHSPLELKMAVINNMLSDLSYFQSRNHELLGTLGNQIKYPYLSKLEESFDAAVDCFRHFGYKPKMEEVYLVKRELKELASHLDREARFVFRDAITDNIIINEPKLDDVTDEEAVSFILSRLAKADGIKYFSGRLYHVDFGTANHLVTRSDDVVHILEHEMCSLEGIVPSGRCAEVSKDESYYLTTVARMFRSWSRRCVYLQSGENRYPNEHHEFYLNRIVSALKWLQSKNLGKHFEHLYGFCSELVYKTLDKTALQNILTIRDL